MDHTVRTGRIKQNFITKLPDKIGKEMGYPDTDTAFEDIAFKVFD
jgi:hypothetical protein